MRKQIIETAALEVAHQVRAVEETIDQALAEIAELQGRMLRARSVTGIGVRTGHDAFQHLAGTLSALVEARGTIGNCHAALAEAKGSIPGLRTTSWGDATDCPPAAALPGHADLRIVA